MKGRDTLQVQFVNLTAVIASSVLLLPPPSIQFYIWVSCNLHHSCCSSSSYFIPLDPFHCAASRQTLIPVSFPAPSTLSPLNFMSPKLHHPRPASHRSKFEICYTVLLLIEFEEENAASAPQAFHH